MSLYSVPDSKLQIKLYRVRWCITVVQGHSRSSKLVSIESPYVISYQSSTVIVCVCCIVSETERFIGGKSATLRRFTHPSLVRSLRKWRSPGTWA